MNNTQSLSRQISQASSRIDRHEKKVKALGSLLGSRVRSGVISPGGLWLAGCAGFMAAEWIHRPKSEPPLPAPEQEPISPQPHRSKAAAVSNADLLLKFALDLGMLWAKANSGGAPPKGSR